MYAAAPGLLAHNRNVTQKHQTTRTVLHKPDEMASFAKPFAILSASLNHCNAAVKRYYDSRSRLEAAEAPKDGTNEMLLELHGHGRVVTSLCWSLWCCLNRVKIAAGSFLEACEKNKRDDSTGRWADVDQQLAEQGTMSRTEAVSQLKRSSRFCIVHIEITTGLRTFFQNTQTTETILRDRLKNALSEDDNKVRRTAYTEKAAGYGVMMAGVLAIISAVLLAVDLALPGGWLTAGQMPIESTLAVAACAIALVAAGGKLIQLGVKEVGRAETQQAEYSKQLSNVADYSGQLIKELCLSVEAARDACRPLQAALAPVVSTSTKLHDTGSNTPLDSSGRLWEEEKAASMLEAACRDFVSHFDRTYTNNEQWAILCAESMEVFPAIGQLQEPDYGSDMAV